MNPPFENATLRMLNTLGFSGENRNLEWFSSLIILLNTVKGANAHEIKYMVLVKHLSIIAFLMISSALLSIQINKKLKICISQDSTALSY